MTSVASRLFAFFVGPELRVAGGGVPVAGPESGPPATTVGSCVPGTVEPGVPGTGRGRPPRRQGVRRTPDRAAPSVAVLGGGAAALAVDLAAALGQRGRHPVAVTAVWGCPAPAPPRGGATGAAERLAAAFDEAGDLPAVAGGDGVVLELPVDPGAAVTTLAAAQVTAAEAGPVVLAVCGPRPAAFDARLRSCDLLVLALPGDAPTALGDVAGAALAACAPGALIVPVVLPGGGLPRPLRHRAAVRQVLHAWDGEESADA